MKRWWFVKSNVKTGLKTGMVMMYAVWCLLYAVWCMLYVVCCMLYDVCCMLYDVLWLFGFGCCWFFSLFQDVPFFQVSSNRWCGVKMMAWVLLFLCWRRFLARTQPTAPIFLHHCAFWLWSSRPSCVFGVFALCCLPFVVWWRALTKKKWSNQLPKLNRNPEHPSIRFDLIQSDNNGTTQIRPDIVHILNNPRSTIEYNTIQYISLNM